MNGHLHPNGKGMNASTQMGDKCTYYKLWRWPCPLHVGEGSQSPPIPWSQRCLYNTCSCKVCANFSQQNIKKHIYIYVYTYIYIYIYQYNVRLRTQKNTKHNCMQHLWKSLSTLFLSLSLSLSIYIFIYFHAKPLKNYKF